MKLYFAPRSRAVRIAWLLEELGLKYELEHFKVGDKTLRSAEYKKIHPMGRIPVLEDDKVKIYFNITNDSIKENDYNKWLIIEAEQDPKKANPFEYGKIGFNHLKKIALDCGFEITR